MEWISVKDKLPENKQYVDIWADDKDCIDCRWADCYYFNGEWYDSMTDPNTIEDNPDYKDYQIKKEWVTYWMPLPEKPKET